MNHSHTLLAVALTCSLATHTFADTVQLSAVADSTLYDDGASGQLSNGQGIGVFSGVTNAGNIRRALLRFDLTGVPPGATITGVSLRLRITQTISGPSDVELHRVLAAWGEGASGGTGAGGTGAPAADCDATWLHRFYPGATCSDTRWSTAGGDFAASPSATAVAGNLGTSVVWAGPGLIADVQAMVDGTLANHGWIVRHVDEQTGITAKRFGAREATNPQDRPVLSVDFAPPSTTVFCSPGLPNSVSSAGASLVLVGSASLAANDNSLVAHDVPDYFGLFVQSDALAPATTTPYGGNLCLTGLIERFPTQLASQGVASRALDFNGSGVEASVLAGETWHYQWFHRDTTVGGGNLSAGLAVTWAP